MYPICLQLTNKLCVVIGGGGVAERKVKEILSQHGCVRLISPDLTEYLQQLVKNEHIEWWNKEYSTGDLAGAFLVFAATSNTKVQQQILADANQQNVLINVADHPDCCDFHVPASIHRGELTIAISTNGKSPAMSAMVRKRLEPHIGEEFGVLLELMSQVRQQVIGSVAQQQEKRILFQKIFDEDILGWIKQGQWELVASHIENVLGPSIEIDWMRIKESRT
ncbi:MAG: siroheme synthase [Desulfobulbus propionicus]|nr:MAG: siroheme synthase [Desulfobulbus propionicus]